MIQIETAESNQRYTHRMSSRDRDAAGPEATFPLPTLLSQALVAFTVEFDNEFELRMAEAGEPGARLSLVVWSNLIRFIPEHGISMRELELRSLSPQGRIKHRIGCLERWGFVIPQPDPTDGRVVPIVSHRQSGRDLRAGWGSGRGIRADWIVRLTPRGLQAREIWPGLFEIIEARWRTRFGKDLIERLRNGLAAITDKQETELPHALPVGAESEANYPPRTAPASDSLPLPTLLSQALLAFTIEFDRQAPALLEMCANTLRVLADGPIRTAEIPIRTGASSEVAGIGWQHRPFVTVETDSTRSRGKIARLTPRGVAAVQAYRRLVAEIETGWETRFGKDRIDRLRDALRGLYARDEQGPLLAKGLTPPPSVARAGGSAPSLGRKKMAAAAVKRARELVLQTEAFVRDPAGALPHHPLWDMNRGFGP